MLLFVRRTSDHGSSRSSASKNEFGMRTELFEFWPETVWYASPCHSVSYSVNGYSLQPCAPRSSARRMYASGT